MAYTPHGLLHSGSRTGEARGMPNSSLDSDLMGQKPPRLQLREKEIRR